MATDKRQSVAAEDSAPKAPTSVVKRKNKGHVAIVKPFLVSHKNDTGKTATWREIDDAFPTLFPRTYQRNPKRNAKNPGEYRKGDTVPDDMLVSRVWFNALRNRADVSEPERATLDSIIAKIDDASGLVGLAVVGAADLDEMFSDVDITNDI